jgi:hypothetical protein
VERYEILQNCTSPIVKYGGNCASPKIERAEKWKNVFKKEDLLTESK